MGERIFKNPDDAEAFMDSDFIGTEKARRANLDQIERLKSRVTPIMRDTYADAERLAREYVEAPIRICSAGEETLDQDLEAMRNGEITPEEMAKRLAEMRAEVEQLRKLARSAPSIEQRAWEQVSGTPGDFLKQVERRFPALMQGSRFQIVLATND